MDDVTNEVKSKIKQTHIGYKCLESEYCGWFSSVCEEQ